MAYEVTDTPCTKRLYDVKGKRGRSNMLMGLHT